MYLSDVKARSRSSNSTRVLGMLEVTSSHSFLRNISLSRRDLSIAGKPH